MRLIKKNYFFLISILICIIFNEYTLVILDKNPPLSLDSRIGIWFINFFILFCGYAINKKNILLNSLLVLIALAIPILIFETLLRTTSVFDQLERPYPSYIPNHHKKYNHELFLSEGYFTEDGFRTWKKSITNLRNEMANDAGCKIAVLGDSFVMGDGLPANRTWPAKLEELINCSVYPFGQNGWSSLEQFAYYETYLKDFEIDYVIVGIVSNDPHPLGSFCAFNFTEDDYIQRHISLIYSTNLIGQIMKNSYALSYIDSVIDSFFTPFISSTGNMNALPISSWGYANWEERLYENDVFDIWLDGIDCFVKRANHPLLFLLTPTTVSDQQEKFFSKIEASLNLMNLEVLNIYPKLKALLGPHRQRTDWANIADAHPGNRQTLLYAEEAQLMLKNLGHEF